MNQYRTPIKLKIRNWWWRRISPLPGRFRAWWPLVRKVNYRGVESRLNVEKANHEETKRQLADVGKALEVWLPKFSQLYMKRERNGRTLSVTMTIDEWMLSALSFQRERTDALRFFALQMSRMITEKIDRFQPEVPTTDEWWPVPNMMRDDRRNPAHLNRDRQAHYYDRDDAGTTHTAPHI